LSSGKPPLILPVSNWPLVLCGPIVRCVDQRTVCIWVALREPCSVKLSLWRGPVNTGSASGLFSGVAEDFFRHSPTLRIGENLHIVAVTFNLLDELAPAEAILLPGEIYSYNLTFTKSDGSMADLKSLGLLEDSFADDPLKKPHLALGYNPNFLPSFPTCPLQLDKLIIAHGSCHKVSKSVTSAFAWLDDMIKNSLSDPLERPHQFFLTGDQIYADEVPVNLLPALNMVGNMLLGHNDPEKMERLPTKFLEEAGVRLWPADLRNFPTGLRDKLMGPHGHTNFTTDSGESHLLSFGEFCAMYIFSWCNVLWPTKEIEQFGGEEPSVDYNSGVLVRPLWDPQNKSPPEIWKIYTGLSDLSEVKFKDFFEKSLKERIGDFAKVKQKLERLNNMTILAEFQHSLPKIRRVLANVPTYMIFDDHEVTDDWNMDRRWYQSVLAAPLGRTVIRNALAAYTIFQDWGNDPLKERNSSNYESLLQDISNLFPKDEDLPPNAEAAEDIERLFGWDGSDESISNPPIKWHYSVSGPKHKVLVLDTRTRRDYFSAARHSPIALLSYGGADTALEQQIPAGPLATGFEVLIVISSVTVIGPPVIETLFQPMVRRAKDFGRTLKYEVSHKERELVGTDPDIESWPFNPPGFEKLLARLEPYRRVVVLSGDVHFGYSAGISYWKKDDQEEHPARIIQFTSSGLKNTFSDSVRGIIRSFSLSQRLIKANVRAELLGWHEGTFDASEILKLPTDNIAAPALLARTRLSPVLIPTRGWPEGTSSHDEDHSSLKKPDWVWRCEVLSDERLDAEIPEAVRPEHLDVDVNLSDPFTDYGKIAHRHADMIDKISNRGRLVFANNLGIIRFEHGSGGELVVRQELLSIQPEAEPGNVPRAYTIHRAILDSPAGFSEQRPHIETTSTVVVENTNPANGAASVPTTITIMAEFSKPVDSSTVTFSTFILRDSDGMRISGVVSLSTDLNTATFKPSSQLAHSTLYSATVTTGVRDRAGNAIRETKNWSFTTG
jgi:hypothetical protein